MMGISKGVMLRFSDLFNDRPPDPRNLLDGLSENTLLKIGPSLIAYDWRDECKSNPVSIFIHFFGKDHPELGPILARFRRLDQKINWRIVNPFASLTLFQDLVEKGHSQGELDSNTVNFNILLYYLLINELMVSTYDTKVLESTENIVPKGVKRAAMYLSQSLRDNDFTNYSIERIFGASLIKSFKFFEFIERDDFLKPHLQGILENYNIETWRQYLLQLIGIIQFAINQPSPAHFIKISFDPKQANSLLFEDFYFKGKEHEDVDFVTLRSKPLIREGESSFIIVFDLFLAEKLFKGIYWLFKSRMPDKQSHDILKQKVSFDFSEKSLTYDVLDRIFATHFNVHGEDIKIKGFTDYYSRKGSEILLFESKDVLINKLIKSSGDWEQIEAFAEIVNKAGYASPVRTPRGRDIMAACGQLKSLSEKLRASDSDLNKIAGYEPSETLSKVVAEAEAPINSPVDAE